MLACGWLTRRGGSGGADASYRPPAGRCVLGPDRVLAQVEILDRDREMLAERDKLIAFLLLDQVWGWRYAPDLSGPNHRLEVLRGADAQLGVCAQQRPSVIAWIPYPRLERSGRARDDDTWNYGPARIASTAHSALEGRAHSLAR